MLKIIKLLEENSRGLYASVILEPTNLGKVWKVLKKVGLPLKPIQHAHITTMYSKSKVNKPITAFNINGSVKLKGFGIFGKGTHDQPYVFVLKVESRELSRAHNELKKIYNIRPTYRDYEAHITLTNDINRIFPKIGKMTEKQKEVITKVFDRLLPELPKSINILKHEVKLL